MLDLTSGSPLGGDEDIVRYLSPIFVKGRARPDGRGFSPRDGDAGLASVNRLGVLATNLDEDLSEIRRVIRMTLKLDGRFARVSVADLRRELEIVDVIKDALDAKEGFPSDPSHALITGLPARDLMTDLVDDTISGLIKALYPGRLP